MNSAIVYAFGVGMVATFNPCGFAMLPAYLSYFLGLENARDTDNRADATVLRALAVGAAMTAGFVVVFGVLGLVLDPILSSVIDKLPWLTIVLGIVLVILGIRLLMGLEITVSLPKISKGPEGRELGSVFVFGISYALVSLSCTLSLFIAAISTVIDQQNFFVGLGAFRRAATHQPCFRRAARRCWAVCRLLRLVRTARVKRQHLRRRHRRLDVQSQWPHHPVDQRCWAHPHRSHPRPCDSARCVHRITR